MEFEVKVWMLLKLIEATKSEESKDYLRDQTRYEQKEKKVRINSLKLTSADLTFLAELAEQHYTDNVPDKNNKSVHNKFYPFIWLARKIRSAMEIESTEDGDIYVKALDQLPLAMKTFFKQYPHKVVFIKNRDGWMLPYIVENIDYTKGSRGQDSYCDIDLKALYRGSSTSMSKRWYTPRKTCAQLLKEVNLVLPTEELLEGYTKRIERYRELRPLRGTQVNLKNMAKAGTWIPMTVDGKSTKAVIDDISDDRELDEVDDLKPQRTSLSFWRDQDVIPLDVFSDVVENVPVDEDDEEDTKQYTALPIHPYIKCFDLSKHRWVEIHVANVDDYEWDHQLADKLILDDETKSLVEILVDSTKARSEDIISGKMSGTIVLATGAPGVGKTLTAEVFSEKIEKSLYVVQCSQLGIDVDTIESNLQQVLDRASRWGSILLIDEADVYIRDRGNDIVHNAIVGVFLRLIEYYNGVMFLTSNRGDIIDDAIISRCTAWIRYEVPDLPLLKKIWEVLSKQFQLELKKTDIDELVKTIPNISGRTVRNLLKLVKALEDGDSSNRTNVEKLVKASKFQKLEQPEGN